MTRLVVVGASLAGLRAAETLRAEGFDGELTVIGAEPHGPYDRPPLSKDLLLGHRDAADIALIDESQREALEATWLLGEPATALEGTGVRLDDTVLRADGVVITTGSRARALPGEPVHGVHTLRTLEDALALRLALPRAARVVIIGAGFIGTEVASAAIDMGRHVTVVDREPVPLATKVGPTVAGLLRDTMLDRGVRLRTNVGVQRLEVEDERIKAVQLTDGTRLPADVVVAGVGATPNVEWLAGSGVQVQNGITTDEWGRTSVAHIVAAGDVACSRSGSTHTRTEHWTDARDMPVVAARTLLADLRGVEPPPPYTSSRYFWSDQFGTRIQVAGEVNPRQEFQVVDGAIGDRAFVAAQFDEYGSPRAVIGWNSPRMFLRWRRRHGSELAAAAD